MQPWWVKGEEPRKPDGSNNGWMMGREKVGLDQTEICSEQTFRTTWTKSLALCGLRPCSWRVQASKEDAWATISTLFPTQSGNRGRMQHQQWTNKKVKSSPTWLNSLSCCFSYQCFCSLTGYLWSLGSSGSCSSRRIQTQWAYWPGSEVCMKTKNCFFLYVRRVRCEVCMRCDEPVFLTHLKSQI